MSKLYNKFKTNANNEVEGVYLDLGFVRIRVARAGGSNVEYQIKSERFARVNKVSIESGALSGTLLERRLMASLYAETLVKSWETKNNTGEWATGIESETGELLPVTLENVVNTFVALPDLLLAVLSVANDRELYMQELVTSATKK